jgi:hypothetical protein
MVTDPLQADIQARAEANALVVEGWDLAKQRQYEEFLENERLEYERCRANREANDLPQLEPLVIASSGPELRPGDDPWLSVLCHVERMPNVVGSLERRDGYIRVRTSFILDEVLGISRDDRKTRHSDRLSRNMTRLGWIKPKALRFGVNIVNGYQKLME